MFLKAFSQFDENLDRNLVDALADDGPHQETPAWRAEITKNLKVAVAFWEQAFETSLHLLRIALEEQRTVMDMTSLSWEHGNSTHNAQMVQNPILPLSTPPTLQTLKMRFGVFLRRGGLPCSYQAPGLSASLGSCLK